jgi:hypothetical protein
MKKLILAAAVFGQLVAATQPVLAADPLADHGATVQRRGGFAGARLHIAFGGRDAGQPRAGLAITPVLQNETAQGLQRPRFGEGAELSLTGPRGRELMLAGRPVANFSGYGPIAGEDRKLGVSTTGWVLIGVGAVAIVGAVLFYYTQDCERIFHDGACDE